MNAAVYIPTRKREEQLPKVIDSFLPYPVDIFIVTDEQFEHRVNKVLFEDTKYDGESVEVITTENNLGIGMARDVIVSDAAEAGYETIIQCDDDNKLVKDTDLVGMLNFAKRSDVIGVGAWKPTYSLFTGRTEMTWAAKEKKQAAYLKVGGYGHMLFALNVERAYEIGGFLNINAHEDDELEMRGITMGYPWYIWTACHAASMGVRYAPGGLSSHRTPRSKFEHDAHHELHHLYSEYVSSPDKKMRIGWSKMQKECLNLKTPLEDINAGRGAWSWRQKSLG